MTDSTDSAEVLTLLPRHVAADGGAKRGRGRPPKLEAKPGMADLEYYARLSQQKLRHIEADEVVRAVERKTEAVEVLKRIKVAVAREASSIEFQRLELEKRGRDGAQTSSRRIDALLRVANLELEMARLQRAVIDPWSEAVQRLAALWVEDLAAVARETLPPEMYDVLMTRLETKTNDWEDRAEATLR